MLYKLSDRIYYMEHNEETDRPVLGYIKGDNFSLMVDAGNSKNHASLFIDEISKLGLPYPNFVGITHSHWDHTYGLCGLSSFSIACNKTNEYLKTMQTWEWSDKAMKQRLVDGEDIKFCDTMIRREYPDRSDICIKTVDLVFEDRLSLDLGNINCELIKIDSSHTDDCVLIYVPQEKVIFLGDSICEDFHHGGDIYDGGIYYKDNLINLINTMKNMDFETAIFSHSEKFTKEGLITWLEDALNQTNNRTKLY